jgi:hypothetical protein
VRRLGVDVGQKFKIRELSSIETLSVAHDKYVSDSVLFERNAKEFFLSAESAKLETLISSNTSGR